MPAKKPPFIRLYENMENTDSGCWLWKGQTGSSGYGQIKAFGSTVSCHRLSFQLYHGDIGDGMEVCHRCDNPSCINPDHLFSATHEDNMRDMRLKGRRVQGKSNPNRGYKNIQSQCVIVMGVYYGSINEAEQVIGLGSGSVAYWLKTNNPKAKRISLDEYLRSGE